MSFRRSSGFDLAAPLLAALASSLLVVGCGMPGAPLPPSLNLPVPVKDLRAVRTGNTVSLAWTMPKRNTDQLLLKLPVRVKLCRAENPADSTCSAQAGELTVEPGKTASLTEQLPVALTAGKPRALRYYLLLENAHGRTAGPSNAAHIVAGAAPAEVTGLETTVRKGGVELRWKPVAGDTAQVRIERLLLTPPVNKKKTGPLEPPAEPLRQNLQVLEQAARARALDRSAHTGQSYQYRVQRVARVEIAGETLELAGGFSPSVTVDVRDIFPPAVPEALAAVAAAPDSGASIDLNWQPNTEADLAGYILYRREGNAPWQRLSPVKPLAEPSFHDATVLPGHTYHYAVSAIDQSGHESRRSAEAEESVPLAAEALPR